MVPDTRLVGFSKVKPGLPDMWLVHVDEIHFDLIIHKDSDLAKEGSLDDLRLVRGEKSQLKCKTCDNKFQSKQILEEHSQNHKIIEESCNKCDKKFASQVRLKEHEEEHTDIKEIDEDRPFGPGYMGWEIEEKNKIDCSLVRKEITLIADTKKGTRLEEILS